MLGTTLRWRSAGTLVAVLVAAGLASCTNAPENPQSGVMGTNAKIGEILLRSVHVDAPEAPSYPAEGEALVYLTLLNQGRRADALVTVTSPFAKRVEIHWDSDCDGTAETVDSLPLRPTPPAAPPTSAQTPPGSASSSRSVSPGEPAPAFGSYFLRMVDLNRSVLAGTTVPLTFRFADAGTVRVEALVQPSNASRPEPTARCTPAASAS